MADLAIAYLHDGDDDEYQALVAESPLGTEFIEATGCADEELSLLAGGKPATYLDDYEDESELRAELADGWPDLVLEDRR